MKKLIISSAFLLVGFFLFSSSAFAKIGVGVNTGKIYVEEKLKAGMIYQLPPITIINTGDEPSEYEVSISYHQDQTELLPDQDWFIFTPRQFHLEADKAQVIEIKINLPLKVEQGDYFAYLEGHPLAVVQKGKTTLGIAAAAKLYFTVVPANIFYGIYYKAITFYKVYAPWPQRAIIAISVVILLMIFKKFFNLQINLKKPDRTNLTDSKQDEEKS